MLNINDFLKNSGNKILINENGKIKHTINPYNIESVLHKNNVVIINLRNDTNIVLQFSSNNDAIIAQKNISLILKSYLEDNVPKIIDREIFNYYKDKKILYVQLLSDLPIIGIEDVLYIVKSTNGIYIWDNNLNSYIILNGQSIQSEIQFVNTNIVNISHNMGKKPTVIITILDNNNVEINSIGEVVYNDNNNLTVLFNQNVSGKIYLQ